MGRWAFPSFGSGASRTRERILQAPLLPDRFQDIHHGGWMLTLGPQVQSLSWTTLDNTTWRYRPASVLPTVLWGIDDRHRVVLQGELRLVRSDGRFLEHRTFGVPEVGFGSALRVVPVPVDLVHRPRPRLDPR